MTTITHRGLTNLIENDLIDLGFEYFVNEVKTITEQRLTAELHGDYQRWNDALINAPELSNTMVKLNASKVKVIAETGEKDKLKQQLQKLKPWRKGPYEIAGIHIDCEWRSDFKWDRIKSHINLNNKRVLDIGCGNGYHCWRMLEQKAKWVLGIDPNILFNLQFRMLNHYAKQENIAVVPLGIEHLPHQMSVFDTVFSMGVLYHRKSPIEHLYELKSLMAKGGELILETLIIEGKKSSVLVPKDRYAKMKNVWFIPSAKALQGWLLKVGFKSAEILDINQTTVAEQRATKWMQFESLADFLDPNDKNLTIEGYSAPRRVVIKAVK